MSGNRSPCSNVKRVRSSSFFLKKKKPRHIIIHCHGKGMSGNRSPCSNVKSVRSSFFFNKKPKILDIAYNNPNPECIL